MNPTWRRCQDDVNNDYPLLVILEADFPQLVNSARRHLAQERLHTDQEQNKRESNPDYLNSKAYQRAARHLRRAHDKAEAKLTELADAAGLRREAFGIPDSRAESSSGQASAPRALKEALLRQIREGGGLKDPLPPHYHLLVALEHHQDVLPEEECLLLGVPEGTIIADAVKALLSLPRHVMYDLHGYRVVEATEYADRRIRAAWQNGYGYVTLIHGLPEVTHWSGIRSLEKGGIKWSLRGRLSQGAWDEYVHPRRSKRHRIDEGAMILAIRPRNSELDGDDGLPRVGDSGAQGYQDGCAFTESPSPEPNASHSP